MLAPSSRHKMLHLINRPDFTIFRWTAGGYLLILGMSLIILPQGNLGVRLAPVWAYAFATFLAGLITLWVIVLAPPRRWRILLASLSILPLLASTWAYIQLGLLSPAFVFFVLALSLLWSALAPPRIEDGDYHPDAVGIVFGLIQLVQGVDILAGPSSITSVPPASGFSNVFFGLLFIGGGLAVVLTQLVASTPDRLRKVVHLVSGGGLLGLLALQATYIDSLYWILGAAVIVRGVVTILLPWYKARMRQVDGTALRPRLALGLITAGMTPALLSIMIFLNLLDEELVGRHFSRPILFGVVLLLSLAAGLVAWWFAGKLTAAFTALVKAISRIPQEAYQTGGSQSTITEVADLQTAVEKMSQTIAGQMVEREQLISRLQDQNQTLAMLEKSFRMVAENAQEVITRFDRNLRHVYINPAITRATGLTPEDYLGKTNREMGMPESLVAEWDAKLESVFSQGNATVFDFSYESPDGRRFYQSYLVPETDEHGHVITVLAIAHDITSLKQAQQHTEQALQAMLKIAYASTASEHGTSAKKLLDSMCDALGCQGGIMVIVVPETQVIHDLVMSGFEQINDVILQRVRGKLIDDRFEDPSIMTRIRDGQIIELDVSKPPYAERQPRAGLKVAVLIPMRLTGVLQGIITLYPGAAVQLNRDEGFALASAAGNLAAMLLERERLFTEREEARVRALAAQRTARYAEELQRVNDDLTLFSHIVSHDLNEPLRMITSYMQLIEKRYSTQLDADAHDFIGFAVDGAVRLKLLLNGLLSYTRVGSRAGKMVNIDGDELLQTTLRDLSFLINETGAVVTHDTLPTIYADPQQIGQLFQNLIANAIKFRKPDAECQIHIGAERQTDSWQFSVHDNGIGIDKPDWERIFLIFQRIQSAKPTEGTGIGLAICKKIVERHHGSIWLESELGQGSTFYFTIPDRSGAEV